MSELVIPTARDWMNPDAFCLRPEDDLFTAVGELVSRSCPAAPVVDAEDRVLGMLTEKDCLRMLSNLTYEEGLRAGLVSDYQSPVRTFIEPGMDVFRVAEVFLETNLPVLPVVEGGRLVGLISRQAMLRGTQGFLRTLEKVRHDFERGAGHQADRPRSIESMQRTAANRTPEQLVRLFKRTP